MIKTSFICLIEFLVGRPCFLYTTLSDLVIALAIGLAIGGAEFISSNIIVGFFRYILEKVLIILAIYMTANVDSQILFSSM